jgi:hypothetical protein
MPVNKFQILPRSVERPARIVSWTAYPLRSTAAFPTGQFREKTMDNHYVQDEAGKFTRLTGYLEIDPLAAVLALPGDAEHFHTPGAGMSRASNPRDWYHST